MTTGSGDSADEDFWRRPDTSAEGSAPTDYRGDGPATTSRPAPAANYPGPPPSVAPPAGWRPSVHIQPPPPRQLPAQELTGLDAAEGSARTITYGVGMLAGAVLVVVMCLLCSRIIF